MREIKFRGQRIDNNEWIYGYYLFLPIYPIHYILTGERTLWEDFQKYDVKPETIGQLTGLKDRHKEDIYEHDICHGHSDGIGVIHWSSFDGGYEYRFPA